MATTDKVTPTTKEKFMDVIKIMAFPALIAIVAYFSKSTVDEVKEIHQTQEQMLQTCLRIEMRQDLFEQRLERLETIVYESSLEETATKRTKGR